MRIYWSVKSIPELRDLPLEERVLVEKKCCEDFFYRFRWLSLVAMLAVGVPVVSLVSICWHSSPWTAGIFAGLVFWLGHWIADQFLIHLARGKIRDYLIRQMQAELSVSAIQTPVSRPSSL